MSADSISVTPPEQVRLPARPSDLVALAARRLRVVDRFSSPAGLELRTFLARNGLAFEWVDLDADPLARFLIGDAEAPGDEARLADFRLPLLLLPDGRRLEAPSRLEAARALGLPTRPTQPEYDLAIVGGGPAGLTAAVYAASEGLRTVVLEREAPGGQAGSSARIENYPGFPDGVSGLELTERTYAQAQRFEAEFVLVNEVTAADPRARAPFRLGLLDGSELRSQAVLVATGVAYRLLEAPRVPELVGRGICYGSRVTEALLYRGTDMFIVGSGNAAGQAAVYMARYARRVTLLVRADSLARTMSHYLIQELEAVSNLTVRYHTEVASAEGNDRLEALVLRDLNTSVATRVPADGLAILIGQKPQTDWADGLLARDGQGFLLTGPDLAAAGDQQARRGPLARPAAGSIWPLTRAPLFLETNVPGVFAAGDVRRGTPKRIASAVGDGALAVQLVHQYLDLYAVADARALNGRGVPRDLTARAGLLKQLAPQSAVEPALSR
jgi:thioredoxin reductase (NADPH)